MIDESLLKSNFVGRDGFRWWIGQIAPKSSQEEQFDGDDNAWGNRMKVRIMGYHPSSSAELSNDNLPWAQIMLPTTAGTGASNYAVNPKLRPGDVVLGFFLDGDNGQLPVVMGAFGRTYRTDSEKEYTSPFVPFTGYTGTIKKPDGSRLYPDQTNESREGSQISPRLASPEAVRNTGNVKDISAFTAIGQEIVFADTCEDTAIKSIKAEINNLLKFIQNAKGKISKYREKIEKVVDFITSGISWIVGELFDSLYNHLEPIIQDGLDLLYKSVFGKVLAATQNPAIAHRAGVASNEAFVIPVKILEEAIPCVAAKVINGLKSLIRNLLKSLIENIKRFVTCAAEQFLGSLLNSIVSSIADGLSSALDGVAGIISIAFDVVDFLRSGVDLIKSIGSLFDCNQNKNKCSGMVKEWTIGSGPKDSLELDSVFQNILNNANNVTGSFQDLAGKISSVPTTFDQIKDSFDIFNGNSEIEIPNLNDILNRCYTGFPTLGRPPKFKIFGGNGTGASAVPIFGSIVQFPEPINNVSSTSNIIGAVITNGGSGYEFPPFVEIDNEYGWGYGAVARSVIDSDPNSNTYGQVTAIYMVSSGEGYPIGDIESFGVSDIYVDSAGFDYSDGDYAYDNLGNRYELTIDDGAIISAKPINGIQSTEQQINRIEFTAQQINRTESISELVILIQSNTGSGAILKPIFGDISPKVGEIKVSIDCPN